MVSELDRAYRERRGGGSASASSDDRAQLLLVGAIAIGIVLIGLTTILNSAVFTENIAGGSPVEVTGDVEEFDREAVGTTRSVVLRVNHESVYRNGETSELNAHASGNVSSYSSILSESYADTGSVYVNITYEDTEKVGTRIVQDDDDDLARNPGQPTWSPLSGPPDARIGWFVMNVDVENVSQTDPVHVELTDTDGTELNVSMRRTIDGKLSVNSSVGGGNVSDVTCEPQNGRVLLDVLGGTSYDGSCSFNSTEYLDPPYSELRFVNGDDWQGKYDIVLNDSASVSGMPSCAAIPQDPCEGIAIWSVTFSTHYQSESVAYNKTHTVSVYDG